MPDMDRFRAAIAGYRKAMADIDRAMAEAEASGDLDDDEDDILDIPVTPRPEPIPRDIDQENPWDRILDASVFGCSELVTFTLADGSGGDAVVFDAQADTAWEQKLATEELMAGLVVGRPIALTGAWPQWTRQRTPAAGIVSSQLLRARNAGLVADLTVGQWLMIQKLYRDRCAYCDADGPCLHLEHIVPIFYGGGTTASNVVPACSGCNLRKQAKPLLSFLAPDALAAFWARHAEVMREVGA